MALVVAPVVTSPAMPSKVLALVLVMTPVHRRMLAEMLAEMLALVFAKVFTQVLALVEDGRRVADLNEKSLRLEDLSCLLDGDLLFLTIFLPHLIKSRGVVASLLGLRKIRLLILKFSLGDGLGRLLLSDVLVHSVKHALPIIPLRCESVQLCGFFR